METRLVLIFCCIATLYSCNGIDEENVKQSDLIKVKILDGNETEISEAIGDGETVIILEAKIPPDADDAFQTVTFKSSDGDFVGIGNTLSQVNVNEEGTARALLKLPLDDGELFLSAEIGTSSNLFKAESSIILKGVDEVIQLKFLDLSGAVLNEIPRADGTSIIQLEGTILHNQDELGVIKFIASNGIFQNNGQNEIEKNIDNNGKAIVSFIVPQNEGPIFFTAKTLSSPTYTDEDNLILNLAKPDEIFIEPSSIIMNIIDPNVINVILTRTFGKVSIGTSVDVVAIQIVNGNEKQVGRFTGLTNTSNANSQISFSFYADTGDIDLNLPVIIRTSVLNDSNDSVISEIELDVN